MKNGRVNVKNERELEFTQLLHHAAVVQVNPSHAACFCRVNNYLLHVAKSEPIKDSFPVFFWGVDQPFAPSPAASAKCGCTPSDWDKTISLYRTRSPASCQVSGSSLRFYDLFFDAAQRLAP